MALCLVQARAIGQEADWQSLFDGASLWGWNSSNTERFQVRDGQIVIRGPAPYLYYIGALNTAGEIRIRSIRVRPLPAPVVVSQTLQ